MLLVNRKNEFFYYNIILLLLLLIKIGAFLKNRKCDNAHTLKM
jgi:hypothetical protein